MSKINVDEDFLYKYMSKVAAENENGLEKATDYNYEFSEEHNEKMKKLMAKEKRNPIKMVASIAVIIMAIGFTSTISVDAVRLIVFDKKIEKNAEGDFFYYHAQEGNNSDEYYIPNYLPENYEMEYSKLEDDWHMYFCENIQTKETMVLSQLIVEEAAQCAVVSGFVEKYQIENTKYNIVVYRYDSDIVAQCEMGESVYRIKIQGELSDSEINKIFENWIKNRE